MANFDSKQVKQIAKSRVKGNRASFIAMVILGSLVILFIMSIVSAIWVGGVYAYILTMYETDMLLVLPKLTVPIAVGGIIVFIIEIILISIYEFSILTQALNVYDGGTVNLMAIKEGFSCLGTCVGIMWGITWRSLIPIYNFIVPFKFSCAFYVKYDNPSLSAHKCLVQSGKLMKGNKMTMFIMMLSFVPLMLTFIFFIPMFIFMPYMAVAMAGVYREITENTDCDFDAEPVGAILVKSTANMRQMQQNAVGQQMSQQQPMMNNQQVIMNQQQQPMMNNQQVMMNQQMIMNQQMPVEGASIAIKGKKEKPVKEKPVRQPKEKPPKPVKEKPVKAPKEKPQKPVKERQPKPVKEKSPKPVKEKPVKQSIRDKNM